MGDSQSAKMKKAYEAVRADGLISGAIGPRDWNRFKQTQHFIPPDTRSLLDAGCDRGHWLHYIVKNRQLSQHLGVDLAENRIAEAQKQYPDLSFQAGSLEELQLENNSYEVVTCLEVLEHIPDWQAVLDTLLAIANRRVVVTVPYREKIVETICIHCGETTPLFGHLHRYDESSFPKRPGWNLQLGYIKDYGIGGTFARRVYRRLSPRRGWLLACYDAR